MRYVPILLLVSVLACSTASNAPLLNATVAPEVPPSSGFPQSATTTPGPRATLDDLAAVVDDRAKAFMELEQIVGMSIGLLQRDVSSGEVKIRYLNYGTPAKGSGLATDEHTLFEIHSISKVFAGSLLALYVQRGLARLDDPVRQYVPGIAVPSFEGAEITLRHLATHRSGLPWSYPDRGSAEDAGGQLLVQFLAGYSLRTSPGSSYLYSSLGFSLLGLALENIGRGRFDDLIVKEIANVLNAPDTRLALSPAQRSRFAQSYNSAGAPVPSRPESVSFRAASASLRSTSADLLKFIEANLKTSAGPLAGALAIAQKPQSARGNTNAASFSGLGWEIDFPNTSSEQFWKNGGGAGGTTYLWFQRESGYGFVILTNKGPLIENGMVASSPADKLAAELKKLFVDAASGWPASNLRQRPNPFKAPPPQAAATAVPAM